MSSGRIHYRSLDARQVAAPPWRRRHQLIQQEVLRPPRSFVCKEEECLVLGVIKTWYAQRAAKAPAESIGLQFWFGRGERIARVKRIALKEPKTGAVIVVAAALADDGQVARLGELGIVTGRIDFEFSYGFDRWEEVGIGSAEPHQLSRYSIDREGRRIG